MVKLSQVLLVAFIGSATSFTLQPTSIRNPSVSHLFMTVQDNVDTAAGSGNPFDFITNMFKSATSNTQQPSASRTLRARDLLTKLVNEEECYSTKSGALAFADACTEDVIVEDCYFSEPITGVEAVTDYMVKRASSMQNKGRVRIDKISDGDKACGFAWTWETESEEGLRGTTFVELDSDTGKISYVREISEPLFKPGDLTLELLKAVTAEAEPKKPEPFDSKTPKTANEVAKYLFNDVQGQDAEEGMRFFSPSILYRDFNYEDILSGKEEVKQFIEDFSFPGIEFRTQKFDDGLDSTCFTWEVVLMDSPETTRGISFYELDSETRLITYVRDVPEPAIKPPPIGRVARTLRPGLGVFQGVKIGSRPDGM